MVSAKVVEVKSCPGKSIFNMVNNLSLDRPNIGAKIRTHEFPHLLSSPLRLVILEFRSIENGALVVLEIEFRAFSLHCRLLKWRCLSSLSSFLTSRGFSPLVRLWWSLLCGDPLFGLRNLIIVVILLGWIFLLFLLLVTFVLRFLSL